MTGKKSQSGIEFLIVTGAVLFLFTVFFVAIEYNTAGKNKEKEEIIVKNLALSVQDEINLASETSDGYYRKFYVPLLISGKDYDISIEDNIIYIRTDRTAISFETKEVAGEIKKGENIIKNENGKVYLNQ